MNPGTKVDRWNLIQDIFQSALELPSSERTAYLTRACGNDDELRSEVESYWPTIAVARQPFAPW